MVRVLNEHTPESEEFLNGKQLKPSDVLPVITSEDVMTGKYLPCRQGRYIRNKSFVYNIRTLQDMCMPIGSIAQMKMLTQFT